MPRRLANFKITVVIPPFLSEHRKDNIVAAARGALTDIVKDADGPVKQYFHAYAPKGEHDGGALSESLKRKELARWRRRTVRSVYQPEVQGKHNRFNYAYAQEFGAGRSRGAYIPKPWGAGYAGFRLNRWNAPGYWSRTWHPGYKGQYYMRRTADAVYRTRRASMLNRIREHFNKI